MSFVFKELLSSLNLEGVNHFCSSIRSKVMAVCTTLTRYRMLENLKVREVNGP